MDNIEFVGRTIRKLRLLNQLSIEELANRVSIPVVDLIKIENCRRALSSENIDSICSVFDISEDELFFNADESANTSIASLLSEKVNMSKQEYEEIKEVELLIDALYVQKQIYDSK